MVIALVVSSFVAVLTEFASNTASTTLLLPVLVSLSQAISVSDFKRVSFLMFLMEIQLANFYGTVITLLLYTLP